MILGLRIEEILIFNALGILRASVREVLVQVQDASRFCGSGDGLFCGLGERRRRDKNWGCPSREKK